MINEKPNKRNGARKAKYSDSFKIQLALEYHNGDYSSGQIARKYRLPVKAMDYFLSWYRKNQQSMDTKQMHPPLPAGDTPDRDIRELERKLALAEMKIAALEKVIAMADEEYRTDLKKKLLPSDSRTQGDPQILQPG